MERKKEWIDALTAANRYETDFIFNERKTGTQKKRKKMGKRRIFLIAAAVLLPVTAVTASRKYIMRGSETESLVQKLDWGTPSQELELPIGERVIFVSDAKEALLWGWELKEAQEITLTFETESLFYRQHSMRIDQALEVGYVYQGEFCPLDYTFEEKEDEERLIFQVRSQAPEEGEYCLYVRNSCSEKILMQDVVLR